MKINEVLDRWFRREIANSPASRDPMVWGHLQNALLKLKSELAERTEPTAVKSVRRDKHGDL